MRTLAHLSTRPALGDSLSRNHGAKCVLNSRIGLHRSAPRSSIDTKTFFLDPETVNR